MRKGINQSVSVDVDIEIALDFLEEQFPNPEQRWGELRALIKLQKEAQQKTNNTIQLKIPLTKI